MWSQESLIACIVQAADTRFRGASRCQKETLETYTNRLKQLEDITNQFKGVEKSFAIQAVRENPCYGSSEHVNDSEMVLLAENKGSRLRQNSNILVRSKSMYDPRNRAVDYAK